MQEFRRKVASITIRSGQVDLPRDGTGAGPLQVPTSVVESAAVVVKASSPVVVISEPEQKAPESLREANLRLRGRIDQRGPITQTRDGEKRTGDR